MRRLPVAILGLALAFIVAVGLWLGDGAPPPDARVLSAGAERAPTSEPAPRPPGAPVELKALSVAVDGVEIRSPGGAVTQFPDDVKAAVVDTVTQYLARASIDALADGTAADTLPELFTEKTRPRLEGPDRRTLTDEGLGRATGGVSAERAAVHLVGLAGSDGAVTVVTSTLEAHFIAYTADGPVLVARTGELVLVKEADAWRIDAYRLHAQRELGTGALAEAGL